MKASAAAVVKSLVLEAGVKSLSPFCEYNVSPLAAETTSIHHKPRARSGDLRTAAMGSFSGGSFVGYAGAARVCAATIRAPSRRTMQKRRATDRRRGIAVDCSTGKNGLVLE